MNSGILVFSPEDGADNLVAQLSAKGFQTRICGEIEEVEEVLEREHKLVLLRINNLDVKLVEKIKTNYIFADILLMTDTNDSTKLIELANLGIKGVFEFNEEIEEIEEKLIGLVRRQEVDEESDNKDNFNVGIEVPIPPTIFIALESRREHHQYVNLWKRWKSDKPMYVLHEKGSELELMTKQVGYWHEEGEPEYSEISANKLLGKFKETDQSGVVFTVKDLLNLSFEDQLALKKEIGEQNTTQGSWVFYINTTALNLSGEEEFPEDWKHQILKHRLTLRGLNERPQALVTYIYRYFRVKDLNPPDWAPDALPFLFNNPWENNYNQLVTFLEAIMAQSMLSGVTRKILEDELPDFDSAASNLSMANIVNQQQNRILKRVFNDDELRLKSFLFIMEKEGRLEDTEVSLDKLPLLFKEFLSQSTKEIESEYLIGSLYD